MNLFEALFVAHFVGDFLFQTSWMAKHKATRWGPLFTHVAVYTASVAVAGWLDGGLSGWAIALVFATHAFLDRRGFVQWWARRIQGVTRLEDRWLLVVTDQVFHIIVLALAVALTRS